VLSSRGKNEGELRLELPVGDVAFLGNDRLLSACNDGLIRLHEVPSCEVVREYAGHIADVRALAIAADGSRFWSGGYDQKMREWKPDSEEPVRIVGTHGQPINDIALSPDGSFAVTACHDKIVRVIDLAPTEGDAPDAVRMELTGHFQAVRAVAVSPDGKTVFSGGDDKTLRGWILAEERQSVQSEADPGSLRSLAFSPDGARLWTASDSWTKVPMWRQYVNWTSKIAQLDFDRSFFDDEPVIDKMKKALPVTVGLNLLAILIIYGVSIPIGIAAAVKRGTTFDNVSSILLFMLWSMPNFWLATMTIMWFSSTRNFNWFPSVGLHAQNADQLTYLPWLKDWGMHLVLPLVAMTYGGFASLSRFVRTSMLETIAQDFVRTARAKGLSELVVIMKHAFRNSLITIITLVGNLLPAMIGGSVIIEFIFSIDGMGKLGFEAILSRDYPVVMAVTTFAAILTLLGILVSDLTYGLADPRISHE
jgi:peptide/nickel transport system permease protein